MTNKNISSVDFKKELTGLFGQPLNEKAEVAAPDLLKNISAMTEGVSQDEIIINLDVLALA